MKENQSEILLAEKKKQTECNTGKSKKLETHSMAWMKR